MPFSSLISNYPVSGSSGSNIDPAVAQVQQLLSMLETGQDVPRPQTSPSQHILGGLGDAILAMATVRAGGTPPAIGPYAAGQRARQEEYEKQVAENARANRTLRNQVRIGMLSHGRYGSRPQLKLIQTTDEAGNPITVSMQYDPLSGTLSPIDTTTGQGAFPKYVPPAIMPGMVTTQGGAPQARILKIPRGGGPTTVVPGPGGSTLEPQPPPGLTQETGGKVGVLQGLPHLREVFDKTDAAVRGSGKFDEIKNWAIAQTAGTRFQPIAMPAPMQQYYNEVRGILAPYVRSVSGLVFPDAELKRYESRMPIPGVTPPDVVETQWDSLIQEMVRDIKAKYGAAGRTPPALPETGNPNEAQPSSDLQEWMQRNGITVKP